MSRKTSRFYKASEKHKQLSSFIKETHEKLRKNSEILGIQEAWQEHIKNHDSLNEYAKSMYELATEHWPKESADVDPITYCRINWIQNQYKNYFFEGGKEHFDCKESILKKAISKNLTPIKTDLMSLINVIDVGSCYNPFKMDALLNVTPIDIAPYSNDVIKCDFLTLKVNRSKTFKEMTLVELPKHSYDIVIFSLFLEYIPCPEQRLLSCQKAYDLLKKGGLLFLISPDSKHQNANTEIIKSWKILLAKLGFLRIKYEKLKHIHCLSFRKCFYKENALNSINWQKLPKNQTLFNSQKFFIPQDFQSRTDSVTKSSVNNHSTHKNSKEVVDMFSELPYVEQF